MTIPKSYSWILISQNILQAISDAAFQQMYSRFKGLEVDDLEEIRYFFIFLSAIFLSQAVFSLIH